MKILMNSILKALTTLIVLLSTSWSVIAKPPVMEGYPPSRESQATMKNYLEYPFNQWTFRNIGAPLNVVMIPREGNIYNFSGPEMPSLGEYQVTDIKNKTMELETLFAENHTDGLVVIKGDKLLFENYFNGFNEHAQHIWFSMSKSLASTAFGLLVQDKKVDLSASPSKYIPELEGSGFDRVTLQHVLDMASSIDFKESYTDFSSDFAVHYVPALNMGWLPGAGDVQPESTEIYGVHDFLAKFIKPDLKREPGDNLDYNSSNADLIGWLISRISGQPFQDYIQKNIWSKLGAEHDAYIAVDRAFMPVVTGGMNSTTRDAARFAMMIRDRGNFNGQQIIPANWIDETLNISQRLRKNMSDNLIYSEEPWTSYHNMWWVIDEKKGEFCAMGIHGQVMYINRSTDTVMVWFSSQPVAGNPRNVNTQSKLKAATQLSTYLGSN